MTSISAFRQRQTALVSILIVTYNSQEDIVECIKSVLAQQYPKVELVIVDNNSTDRTVEILREKYGNDSRIRIVVNHENTGYAGGNNLGFRHANGDLIVILNPDSVVDRSWLSELLNTYYAHEKDAGIVCSNVLLFDRPDRINACGNDIHITGLVFSRFYREHISRCSGSSCRVPAPSGASMMFSRAKLESIGRKEPFDSSRFFMEYSDIDLAIEFLKKGQFCYVSHSSKMLHKHKFKMNPLKMYILETGRYQLLGHFTTGTLVKLLPALLLTEAVVWAFILGQNRKLIGPKLRANWHHPLKWRSAHRENNDQTNDLALIKAMTSEIVIYNEFTKQNEGHLSTQRGAIQSNKFFEFTRRFLINSLSSKMES